MAMMSVNRNESGRLCHAMICMHQICTWLAGRSLAASSSLIAKSSSMLKASSSPSMDHTSLISAPKNLKSEPCPFHVHR